MEMIEIKRYRPIQPSTTEALSRTKARQEPLLLSFRNSQADEDEIINIEEPLYKS